MSRDTPNMPFVFGFLPRDHQSPSQAEEKQLSKQPQGGQESNPMGDSKENSKKEAIKKKVQRVVLLSDKWGSSKGGMSTFNRQVAIHLAKRSDLEVICYLTEASDGDISEASKYKVTLIQAQSIPGDSDPLLRLRQWPSGLPSPDVIISHGLKFGSAAYLIRQGHPGCKWVHFVHVDYGEMGKNQNRSCEMSCCRSADVVVAVGPQLLDKYSKGLVMERKKVHVFYPGLSKEFLDLPQKTFEGTDFHIYIFCRCSEDIGFQGVDILSNAVMKLGKKYKVHVLDVAEDCNNREELKSLLCQADLVVMPSQAEAFGMIGIEALTAGVPLLVSAASGLGITLKKLTFGEICVVESDDDWATKIESVKDIERSQRNERMVELRKQYDEKYQWEDQCSKLAKLFRN